MTTETTPVRLERNVPGVGLIEFVESEHRRDYWFTAEGNKRRRRLPSVTSILRQTWPKPALLEWYAKHGANAETLLDQAAARGKSVHRFIEVYMATGELMDTEQFAEEHRPYLRAIASFLWEYDPQPIATELLVAHPEMGYAGRLDLVATIRGKRTLLDFKSNPRGRVYTEAHVQTTAYAIAAERCGDPPPDEMMIVGVSDTGAFNPIMVDGASKLWGAALAFYGEIRKFERGLDGGSEES